MILATSKLIRFIDFHCNGRPRRIYQKKKIINDCDCGSLQKILALTLEEYWLGNLILIPLRYFPNNMSQIGLGI